MLKLCNISNKEGYKIFLLGGENGIGKITRIKLIKKYSKIKIVGTHSGNGTKKEDKQIIDKINKSEADLLFVAYGAPKQEKWIYRNLKLLKSVKVAIGVGGSFDFISEKVKRAPKIMRKLNLEWLYRLIKNPKRIKRIINASIVFPIKVLKKKLK